MTNNGVLVSDFRSNSIFKKNHLVLFGKMVARESINETEVAKYADSIMAANDSAYIAKHGAPVERKFNHSNESLWHCMINPVFWILKFRGRSLPKGFVFRYARHDVAELQFIRTTFSTFSVNDKNGSLLGIYFISHNYIYNSAKEV